ncbi:MAG: divergent PAP2 family protein [Treponema sp.]|nr:divergent PAP2 family protein [Treponema sp.]MBR6193152.1 divergent PAP2 family protein [Treponema sp.]
MDNAKDQFISFIRNPVLLSCIFSWLSAQFVKTLINLFSGKIHSVQELFELLIWRTGGMPSSHSALVSTLCTTIAFRSGINSDVFLLSLGFFMVTIRDAVGVRRANGLQAKIINKIGKSLAEKKLIDEFKPVKEVNGHTPVEVAIGCLLGFFIGLAFSLFK